MLKDSSARWMFGDTLLQYLILGCGVLGFKPGTHTIFSSEDFMLHSPKALVSRTKISVAISWFTKLTRSSLLSGAWNWTSALKSLGFPLRIDMIWSYSWDFGPIIILRHSKTPGFWQENLWPAEHAELRCFFVDSQDTPRCLGID